MLVDALMKRISSPIAGPFLLTWSFCNWKIILHVFGSGQLASQKIDSILSLLNWTTGFWIPLGFTAFYIFVMPFLIIELGKFESYCARLTQRRDDIHELKKTLYKDVNLIGHIEFYRSLLRTIALDRSQFKRHSELLFDFSQYVVQSQRGNFGNIISEVRTSNQRLENDFKEYEALMNSLSNRSIMNRDAAKLNADIKNLVQSIETTKNQKVL